MKLPSIETRSVVAFMATLAFVGAYFMPWLAPIPKGAENYVGQMQGALIAQWVLVMSWYFGSSEGAAETRGQLDKALDKLPDAKP